MQSPLGSYFRYACLGLAAVILTLSIRGRDWSDQLAQVGWLAPLERFFLVLLIGLLFFFIQEGKKQQQSPALLLPLLLIFFIVPLSLENPIERLHFFLFGLYGYCCGKAFSRGRALSLALLLAIGDEVLQGILPDRYGDIRDVAFNTLAALGGLGVALAKAKDFRS